MNPAAKEFTLSAAAAEFVPGGAPAPVAVAAPAPAPEPAAEPAPEPAAEAASDAAAAETPAEEPAPKEVKVDLDDAADDGYEVTDEALQKELSAIAAAEGKAVEDLVAQGDDDVDDDEEEEGDDDAEVDDEREPINVVFIGHVDAGKSTLSGQILYQCNMVDERTIEKYKMLAKENNRESWFLSYIMDTNEEEQAKGKTVEVGRAYFNSKIKRYTILDAPGHKNYVPNMIGGAAQADIGVLVISARKSEFETGFHRGGQTREHAMLCKTLGVGSLVVVINKMDDETVEWRQSRYDEIEGQLRPFLQSIGYPKANVHFVPISAFTGANVVKNAQEDPDNSDLKALYSWYKGESLVNTLDLIKPMNRDADGPVRVPVLDKVKDRGVMQVLGKLEQGTIRVGDKLVLSPNMTDVEVSAIYTDQAKIRKAGPGENLRISVKGVADEGVQRGFMLSSPGDTCVPCVNRFEAQLVVLELLPHKTIFSSGYKAVFHIHTAVEECIVTHLLATINKKTGKVAEKKPKFVKAGAMVNTIVRLARPLPVELFSTSPQLGRFTLRDEGKTIAIGKITRLPGAKKEEA